MAATIAHRALEMIHDRTHAQLRREIYGTDSFAIDDANRLPPDARSAAITIADGLLPLNSDDDVVKALLEAGYQASRLHRFISGIGAYARNRRNPI